MHFGYPGTALRSNLQGGLDGQGYHFYSKFSKLTVKDLFDAFNVQQMIPRHVQDITFPDGLVAGVASPKGKIKTDVF